MVAGTPDEVVEPQTRTSDFPTGADAAMNPRLEACMSGCAPSSGSCPVISLADYSPTTLKFLKSHDLAAVYVFAVEGGRPCALGLKYRFDQVQSQHPRQITIEHVAWTPSAATAALIAEDVSHRLAARAMNAGWYHLDVADAIAAVRKACRMFPSTRIVQHEALMAQLASHGRRAWA